MTERNDMNAGGPYEMNSVVSKGRGINISPFILLYTKGLFFNITIEGIQDCIPTNMLSGVFCQKSAALFWETDKYPRH